MKVQAIKDHLNNRGERVTKHTIYNAPLPYAKWLISIGLVREHKESPRIEKADFVTKPERIEAKKPEQMGWHELRAYAKELEVFSKDLNKEELIEKCNKKLNK